MTIPALVVFDLVGTTLEDSGYVADAFRQTMESLGVAVGTEQIRACRGASKREAIHRLLEAGFGSEAAEKRLAETYGEFCRRLRERFATGGVRAIAGAAGTLAWLRDRGARLAATTGMEREIADLALGAIGWDDGVFDAVICSDEVVCGRPAPYMIFRAMEQSGIEDVRQVANVGDTVLDLMAGWNAAVGTNVAVLGGAHSVEQLRQAPHTHILDSVAVLPGLWPGS